MIKSWKLSSFQLALNFLKLTKGLHTQTQTKIRLFDAHFLAWRQEKKIQYSIQLVRLQKLRRENKNDWLINMKFSHS